MLKFLNYLFALKTFIMIALIEQIKHHNQSQGLESEITLVNEVLLAVLWPGIFGLFMVVILLALNVARFTESKK